LNLGEISPAEEEEEEEEDKEEKEEEEEKEEVEEERRRRISINLNAICISTCIINVLISKCNLHINVHQECIRFEMQIAYNRLSW